MCEKIVTKSLKDKMKMLTPERKNKINERANQLISEEMALHDLRISSEKHSKSIIKPKNRQE